MLTHILEVIALLFPLEVKIAVNTVIHFTVFTALIKNNTSMSTSYFI